MKALEISPKTTEKLKDRLAFVLFMVIWKFA